MAETPGNGIEQGGSTLDRLRHEITIFVAAVLVVLLAFETSVLMRAREDVLATAQRSAGNFSHASVAYVEQAVSAVDAALLQISLNVKRSGLGPESNLDWNAILTTARSGLPSVGSLSIVDTDRIIRYSTIPEIVGASRADSYMLKELFGDPSLGLVADTPLPSLISGTMLMPFGRRLVGPDGALVGAVVATVIPERWRAFYGAIQLRGATLSIVHPSGALFFVEPSTQDGPHAIDEGDSIFRSFKAGALEGSQRGPLVPDGPEFVSAFRTSAMPSLLHVTSIDRAVALQGWRSSAVFTVAAMAALVAMLGAAWFFMTRELAARRIAERALARRENELAQAQKMEAMGQLTGGLAHDFNNLLTVVVGSVERVRDALPSAPAEAMRAIELIDAAAQRGAELTARLLAFARKQPLKPRDIDVNALISDMSELLKRSLGEAVEIHIALDPAPCFTTVDPVQLETAILNLCVNARDAMGGQGRLTVETAHARLDETYAQSHIEVTPGDYVMLAITDTGTGMSPEVLAHVFEPFFTTKPQGKGTGLGLSMVYGFVKQSKGHVKVYSEPRFGTSVKIYLPKCQPRAGEMRPAAAPAAAATVDPREKTILVVDDDDQVRDVALDMLARLGYRTIAAASAERALELLAAEQIDLVFSDVILGSGGNGVQMVREARMRRPGLKAIFVSGYPKDAANINSDLDASTIMMTKPYNSRDLAATLRRLLGSA